MNTLCGFIMKVFIWTSSNDFAKAVMNLCYLFHINNGSVACVRRHTYVLHVCVVIHMCMAIHMSMCASPYICLVNVQIVENVCVFHYLETHNNYVGICTRKHLCIRSHYVKHIL